MGKHTINRGDWKDARVQKIVAYLRNPSVDNHRIKRQLDYYKDEYKFTQSNGRLFATDNDGVKKEILPDSRVEKVVRDSYEKSDEHIGKIPKTTIALQKKYINISHVKVQRAIKSSTTYQLNDARTLQKPRGGKGVVRTSRPGERIECDLMVLSNSKTGGILPQNKNGGKVGLLVITDAFSGFTLARPYDNKSPIFIARLGKQILQQFAKKMKLKGGMATGDQGAEMKGEFPQMVTSFGLTWKPLRAHAPAQHVERRNGMIRANINSRLSAKNGKSWYPDLWRKVVTGLNNSPFTDWRKPQTPNEILKLSDAETKAMATQNYAEKRKRNEKHPGANVKQLTVGDWVRVILETKDKGRVIGQKGPKQKWSSKSYEVTKVTESGMITLSGMPKRRFRRHQLQKIPGKRDVAGKNIKNNEIKSYKPPPTPPARGPETGDLAAPTSGPGSKRSPFASKGAAYAAGYKKTDHVYYRWGGKLYRTLR